MAQWFPREVKRAERIGVDQARREIVRRYVNTVVAAKSAMIGRVFGIARGDVAMCVDDLIMKKILRWDEDWLTANE